MTGAPTRALQSTAYHEAGHAIARFALGRRIDRVSILPDADSLGHVRGQVLPSHLFAKGGDISDVPTKTVEDQIVILLAGPLAEKRFTGRWNRVGASSDYEGASTVAVSTHGDDDVRDAFIRYLEAVGKALIDVHWYLVEALAAALLERETLSGVQVHRVIRAAIAEADPTVLRFSTLGPLSAHGWRQMARVVGVTKRPE
jgi:hypothetical protein